MKEKIRNSLKRIFRLFGLEITAYSQNAFERARALDRKAVDEGSRNFLKLLITHDIDLVLDVGANTGDWAKRLFETGYEGRIVSFEPLSLAYEELVKKSKSNPEWAVAQRCALGDTNGEAMINIAGNSESSSILPMLNSHIDAAPRAAYVGSERVKVCRLDTIAPVYLRDSRNPFLKIDVQGYEKKVLGGAGLILPQIKGLQLEISLVPLYDGETLFEDMLKEIKSLGFELWRVSPGFYDYRSGRMLQVNCEFFRT